MVFKFYEPAHDVPKIPTASSIQIRKKVNKIIPKIIILFLMLFTFFITKSIKNAAPNKSDPIIKKSLIFHLTSLVNCIAINGTSNRINTDDKIILNLLYFKDMNYVRIWFFNVNWSFYFLYFKGLVLNSTIWFIPL